MRQPLPLAASTTNRSEPTAFTASYRHLFGLPGFPRLAAATVLGRTGGQLWQIALILFVLQRFHSPALAGFTAFAAIVPGLAVSPIAGVLLDRHRRLRLIQLDYALAATTLVLIAVLSLAHQLGVDLLLAIVALSSLTSPLSSSGTRALFPLVVPRDLWDRANAVDSASMALAMVAGPALAGFFVAWFGGEGAFLIAAGVFVLAGIVVLGLREPTAVATSPERLARAAWQALVYVLRHRTLRGIVITLWATNVPYGILSVALPVLVLRNLHGGAGTVGALWSVAGIATVIAGIFVGRINSEGRERPMILVGLGIGALGYLLTLVGSPLALLAAMALLGFAAGPVDLGLFALRQRRTDPRWFGRIVAVSMSLNFAGVPVGSALAGPILERSIPLALLLAVVIAVAGCAAPLLVIPRAG
ncbi:MAG TPA: MFS transporter [Ktedonobacterales bacterium]|jgi:MFS family permease|nr:MFS transporter [Ktedonobacterales bacterium]